jgi:hypothetical protein
MAKTPEEKAAAKAAKEAEKAANVAEAAAAPSADHTAPAAPEPDTPAKGDIVVKYRDHRGEPTERVFSKEVHGKDFAKLAEEFKATNATRIIE